MNTCACHPPSLTRGRTVGRRRSISDEQPGGNCGERPGIAGSVDNRSIPSFVDPAGTFDFTVTATDGAFVAQSAIQMLSITVAVAVTPPVARASTKETGYLEAAADGGAFTFDRAAFVGSTGGRH